MSGPGAFAPAERQAFLADRAAEGLALVRRFGLSRAPPRRRPPWRTRNGSSAPVALVAPEDLDDPADRPEWQGAHDAHTSRHPGLAAIFRELCNLTRRPEDRIKLQRAMRAAATSLDWPLAFPGRASVTVEELRRLSGRRIAQALHHGPEPVLRPVSDDLAAMWRTFPVVRAVSRQECWWASPGAQDPRFQDPRLPPAALRGRTLNPAGLFELHRRVCDRHGQQPDGSWRDESAHWQCDIHQQILSLCDLRLPFRPGARPPPGEVKIWPQQLETDPELAPLLEEVIESEIALGSLVYARVGEPRLVVHTKGVYKWAFRPTPEELAACGDTPGRHPDMPALARLARQRATDIVADAVTRSRPATGKGTPSATATSASPAARLQAHASGPGPPPSTRSGGLTASSALCRAIRAACGPPKVRVVSGHHLGCNPLCEATPMVYRSIEELAGRIRRGWWIVINDHFRGYKAMTLALEDRPYLCLWHPTRPGVILMTIALDFGLKNAPYFFSTFTALLLQQVLACLGPHGFSMYYLDDNGAVCRAQMVQPLLRELDALAPVAGFEWAIPKRQVGLSAKCLGRRVDTESNELTAIPVKILHTLTLLGVIIDAIDAASSGRAPTVDLVETQFIRQITGTLGWLAACSYAGLLHMGPFYYAVETAAGALAPRLSRISGLREACLWWIDRAVSGRLRGHKFIPLAGIPMLRIAFDDSFDLVARAAAARGAALTDAHNVAIVARAVRDDGGKVVCLQADAGAAAWAVITGTVALWGLWMPAQRDWSSGGRELYGPLQAFLRLPDLLRDAFIVLGLDNASDALALCLGRSRAPVERRLMAAVFEAAHDLNSDVVAWWCSRRMNAGPDELSKCTSPSDARRWASAHGFELVVCEDVRDGYALGSLARSGASSA